MKKKAKIKSLPKLKKELQERYFNLFIRLRDSKDGIFKCISCGETKSILEMNAGHFYPVKGYDSIRFCEWNVNGECRGCNGFDKAHLIGYARNLEKKIGPIDLEVLHEMAAQAKQKIHQWKRYQIEEMIEEYKQKLKEIRGDEDCYPPPF